MVNSGGDCTIPRKSIYIKLSKRMVTSYAESYADALMSDETIRGEIKYHGCVLKISILSVSLTDMMS